jgi:hypothetical protein
MLLPLLQTRERNTMAQQVHVRLIDDLDGSEAEETVAFAVDGSSYEIDLSKENAAKMRDALAPYVGGARRATGRAGGRATRSRSGSGRSQNSRSGDIRAWARSRNMKISDRGRIPADIAAEYDRSNAGAPS